MVRGARVRTAAPVNAVHNREAGGGAERDALHRQVAELLIENGRLRAEAQERLAEQTATADVLRVISESPTALQHVLDTISHSAARLTAATGAALWRVDGDVLRRIGFWAGEGDPMASGELNGLRLDHNGPASRAALTRQTVHVPDMALAAQTEEFSNAAWLLRQRVGSMLAAPLLRDGEALGALVVRRLQAVSFTPSEIALLETFADQAVIAIENARLFSELEERLVEQTATADVLRVISESPTDIEPVLDVIIENAMRVCGADDVLINRVDGDHLIRVASRGPISEQPFAPGETPPPLRRPMRPDWLSARAVMERRSLQVDDITGPAGEEFATTRAHAARTGFRTNLSTPMLIGGTAVGVIALRRREVRPFTERQVRLLEGFANQAAIALENTRLFAELQQSNRTLTEALEQQTASAEVLQAISRSPADAQAVLDAIVERAARLCEAPRASIYRYEHGMLAIKAWHGYEGIGRGPRPAPPQSQSIRGRAFLERLTVHVPDMLGEADRYPASVPGGRAVSGSRAQLSVPLVRDEEAIGVLTINRTVPGPFSPQQIKLLETFADQAVIAIENARLFSELQERDDRRAKELERASAIQQRLLPDRVEGWPGVLEVAVRFRPAVETSGDFYDVVRLAPAREGALSPLQIAVGDVAGKGMSAALVTALARSALRSSAAMPTQAVTPAGTLRVAGSRLHEDVGSSHFVACALAVLEPPGLHHRWPLLRLSNAAQVPVLLCRDGASEEITPPGYRLPLGAQADGAYRDAEVELRPGDVVVFSSDGLVEAPARAQAATAGHLSAAKQAGELFGFERLAHSATHWAIAGETAEAVAEGIWRDVTAWCGEESHHDDMTLLVLRVAGAAAPGTT